MELELKLIVPPERRDAVLASLELADAPGLPLSAHYFDTPDQRLAAHGVSVRLRREGQAWIQTVKAAGDSQVRRLEDNVTVKAKGGRPTIDLARHQGTREVCQVLQAALAVDEPAQGPHGLLEWYSTDVVRRVREMRFPDETIEIAFDEGTVQAQGAALPICEVELELKAGHGVGQLFLLARSLVTEHGLWLSTLAKSQRGQALARAGEPLPVQRAGRVTLDPKARGDAQLRAMVRHCLDQILPNASHVAAGSHDAEQIHQLRVGIRRLRTVLREVGTLSERVNPTWEGPLADTFRDLGAYRDQDAVQEAVGARLAAAGAPTAEPWADAATPLPRTPDAAVRDGRFQLALLELLEFTLEDVATPAGMGPKATRRLLIKRLGKLHQKVVADGRHFHTLPAEQQHQVRKRLKRLRYLSEFAAPAFGKRSVERYLRQLRPAQDALGEHNDDAVALEGFQRRTAADGRAWFAVGWLTARQARTARRCRRALKQVGAARTFWP